MGSRFISRPGVRAAVVAIAWLTLSGGAAAQATGPNGKIAFTMCEPGGANCDIWVMNADGSEQINLTNTPDIVEMQPVWSPDGTRIAYIEGTLGFNRMMVMNADGSGVSPVTPTTSQMFAPSWSPGGTQLAFARLVPGEIISTQFDILVANVDGSGERNLTNSDFDEFDPAWSPDGSRIAFAGVRQEWTVNPITGEPEQAAQHEIVSVRPDGSGELILSAGERGTERGDRLEEDRAPAWSPDGTSLVFQSQSVDPCCPPWQIWMVNADGTGAALLSDNPDVNDLAPSFSPDGTLILFTSDRDAEFGGDFDIYTMPVPAPAGSESPVAAAASIAAIVRLTNTGGINDADWGRDPDAPPPRRRFALTVARAQGVGASGLVASVRPGIFCGRDCAQLYAPGALVALVALPGATSRFAGWAGPCFVVRGACIVSMSDARVVAALFVRRRGM